MTRRTRSITLFSPLNLEGRPRTSHPLHLLGLPVEVRRLIYAHLLSDFQCIPTISCRHIKLSGQSGQKDPLRNEMSFFAGFKDPKASSEHPKASLVPLFVNKQIHDEYKPPLYLENTFHLPSYVFMRSPNE